jgi:tRNA (adenine57-N1/adenine58-N1)-methyltransferase
MANDHNEEELGTIETSKPTIHRNMFHSRIHIEAGDVVIVFMVRLHNDGYPSHSQNRDNMQPLTITPGEVFHNKFGRYPHDELIGVKFGSKVGFITLFN